MEDKREIIEKFLLDMNHHTVSGTARYWYYTISDLEERRVDPDFDSYDRVLEVSSYDPEYYILSGLEDWDDYDYEIPEETYFVYLKDFWVDKGVFLTEIEAEEHLI